MKTISSCIFSKLSMDDLLALFDENPPEEVPVEPSSPADDGQNNRVHNASSSLGATHKIKENEPEESLEERRIASLSGNADQRVGFRIGNRLVASMDLIDMLSSHPYHSPASLAAMSLKQLNALLVDPAQVLDTVTVAGKTNLITVGIVFSNSGTRIASSGNAFCILTIGTLRSGPSATVMLFGAVYGKFCKVLTPGKAIAVMYPRIVPPKPDYQGETSITFSLNDENQIRVLGTATDFAFCKAKIRGKNENGVWVADARRCRNFVDKTVCEYCQAHRGQANNKKAAAAQSRMQELRQEGAIMQFRTNNNSSRNGRIMTMPSIHMQQSSRISNGRGSTGQALLQSPRGGGLSSAFSSQHLRQGRVMPSKNSILNPQPIANKNKFLTQRSTMPLQQSNSTRAPLTTSIANPYARKGSEVGKISNVVTPSDTRRPTSSSKSFNLSSIISTGKRKQSAEKSASSKRSRAVNTDTSDFDGSVPIPKPKGRMAPTTAPTSCVEPRRIPTPQERDQSSILERQKALAEKLRCGTIGDGARKLQKKSTQQIEAPVVKDGWCAPLDDAERERLRNVKSAFATEADAEKIAASRHKIVELEKEEERKTKSKNKKESVETSKQIRKVWQCINCQHVFTYHPQRCFNLGHDVSVARELRQTATKEQKLTALSNKKADEGGLKLGSGIEWSWNRFS